MLYEYNGQCYPSRSLMCAARRGHYAALVRGGMNFAQAARAVGVSKRTGRVWRHGRTRASGRNEKPSVDLYSAAMKTPKTISSLFLSQDERRRIADLLQAGMTQAEIARTLGRSPSTISREIRRGRDPARGPVPALSGPGTRGEPTRALRCLVWSPSIYSGVAGGDFWCLGAVLMRWRQAFCPSP